MPAGNIVSDPDWVIISHMENITILDIGPPADLNFVDIAANNRLEPNAGIFAHRYRSDHIGGFSPQDRRRHIKPAVKKTLQPIGDPLLDHKILLLRFCISGRTYGVPP